ncbi:MAG TPA: hypothetical protein VGF52_00510, partial [Tepidisphaeraceae bacterium]
LDELAQAVASSSGLGSSRLRAANFEIKSSKKYWIMIAALVVIFLAALGAWFAMTRYDQQAPAPSLLAVDAPPTPTANFCGTPIGGNVVIYVLDRGSGTSELFSYLKEATFKSVESLGRDRKFQIIFWNNGSDDAYPDSGPTFATPQNIDTGRHLLDGIIAHGQSDARPALIKAMTASPDLIILASGKGDQLDDDFTQQVLQICKTHPVKIDTFDLGESQLSRPLKEIAHHTGGQSSLIDAGVLHASVAE